MHRISNSQVVAFNRCTREYYNSHILKLAKRKNGKARSIGIVGHGALQVYYEKRLEGASHEEGISYANTYFIHVLEKGKDTYPEESIFIAKRRVAEYFKHYGSDDNWKPLAIEKMVTLKMTDEISMPTRLDLLVYDQEQQGAFLVDTKFTYDYWTETKLQLSPQFPKYLAALRQNGIPVKGAIVNQIRYRELKDPMPEQLFLRTPIPMTDYKIANNLSNHIRSARKIVEYKQLSKEEQEAEAIRLQYDKTCDYCDFKILCDMQINGADTTVYIGEKFKKNTYGYDDKEDKNDNN